MSDGASVVSSAKQRLDELKTSFKDKTIDEETFKTTKTALLKEMEKARNAEKKAATKEATEEKKQDDINAEPPTKKAKTSNTPSDGTRTEKAPNTKVEKEAKNATKKPAATTEAPKAFAAPVAKAEITSLSLHVSQLAFDVSKQKLREYFAAHNCTVAEGNSGVRLCFAKNGDPTGVAFVDMVIETMPRDLTAHA
jgi:RNA recognition motif-containing protein